MGKSGFSVYAKKALFLILPLLALGCVFLRAETPDAIPNPRVMSGSFVQDSGAVLGPEYVRLIDGICQRLKAATGAELAVVTVNDLGGMTIEDFADRLYRRFGVGEKGKDNGLLLLFSLQDRWVRLEVGYGLEGALTDAKASSILDSYAVPYFRSSRYGRGLFLAARAAAETVASSQGLVLGVIEPASWPEQVTTPMTTVQLSETKKRGWDPRWASLILAGGLFGFALLGVGFVLLRFRLARGMAARTKVIGKTTLFTVLMWIAAVIGFFLVLGFSSSFLAPLIAQVAPVAATFGQGFTRRWLRRRLNRYHLKCASCGQPMNMLSEADDDQFLSAAEAAEEKAGGMDYEFWKCGQCGHSERLAVTLGKAGNCPKCRRRTLTTSRTTLAAATTSHGGREQIVESCLNPDCGYRRVSERSTSPLSSGSSSSGSGSSFHSSSSSSSSFGGGRSGGGGASKSW